MKKYQSSIDVIISDSNFQKNVLFQHIKYSFPLITSTLQSLKTIHEIKSVYFFTNDKQAISFAEEHGCKVFPYPSTAHETTDPDSAISFCLETLQNEGIAPDHVLLVRNATDAFFRFPVDALLSALESEGCELAFSAEKHSGALWQVPATEQQSSAGGWAEPLGTLHTTDCQVRETGDLYAFSVAAMREKKSRFLLRAKPVFPLDEGRSSWKSRSAEHRSGGSPDQGDISEKLAEIMLELRRLDGTVKSFILSRHAATGSTSRLPTASSPSFPNGIQRVLIFFHAFFVWLVGGKPHYVRLKKDPAEFFRVTQHPFNLFFLKILGLLGTKLRG